MELPVVVVLLVIYCSSFFCYLSDDRITGARSGIGGGLVLSIVSKMVKPRSKGVFVAMAYDKRVYYNGHNLNNKRLQNITLVVRLE